MRSDQKEVKIPTYSCPSVFTEDGFRTLAGTQIYSSQVPYIKCHNTCIYSTHSHLPIYFKSPLN